MLRKQIVATDEVDSQNQRIPSYVLQEMANGFSEKEYVTRMGIAHDATLLPVGKVFQGRLVTLDNGAIGLEVQIDDFMDDFYQIAGPDNEPLYYGTSTYDSRPFTELWADSDDDFTVSLNPIDFTKEDFLEIEQFVTKHEQGQVETLTKKASEPEVEIILTLATRALEYLIIKKVFEKSADKVADDISHLYDKIKEFAKYVFSRIKGKRTVTYILSAPNQPVELIVCCDNAEVLAGALSEKDSGYISETYEKFSQLFDGEIKKIQFLFDKEKSKWELNYITTNKGDVIGTEKCYKRTVKLYNETMESPTAGFSIGASATYSTDEIVTDITEKQGENI